VHEGGFEVRQGADGRITFLQSNGSVLEAAPALPMAVIQPDPGRWVPDDIPVWDGTPFDAAYAIDVLYGPSVTGGP
jgi:hypothetical protein